MAGSPPDYILAAMIKDTDIKASNIGAAWRNSDGTLNIRLNPFTILEGNPNLVLKLFPSTQKSAPSKPTKRYDTPPSSDDIPF